MAGFVYNFIIFATGLAVGSFLNVVIFRLENGGKIINDRSKCLKCKHILAWHDLFPVLSFIFLKGKCRYCREKISWQYPTVELATGIIFVLITNYELRIFNFPISQFPNFPISILYLLFIASVLIVIFAYDLKHYIIPDKVVYLAIMATFIYRLFELFEVLSFGHWNLIRNWELGIGGLITIFNPFVAAILAGVFFLSIVLLTRGKGMGGGDVKLGFLMGMILGWPVILLAVFSSFIFGSITGLCLIAIGKKKMKSMIPFGPFLVIGTFMAMFWGEEIVKWYFGLTD